jgi:hypothetical protein
MYDFSYCLSSQHAHMRIAITGNRNRLLLRRPAFVVTLLLFVSSLGVSCGGGSSQSSSGGGGNSNPTITSLSPPSVEAGSSSLMLKVFGTNLDSSCVISWNFGNYQLISLPTTFISGTELQVAVDSSQVAQIGFASVSASCASGLLKFIISGFPRTEIDEPANDLVWDSKNQVIYLSVPPTVPGGSGIAILSPFAAKFTFGPSIGNNPDVLAISDDSQFLYVGLDNSSSIQRFVLPQLRPDISIPVGPSPDFPWDIEVAPAAPHTIAVSIGNPNILDNPAEGVSIFDDVTPRTNTLSGINFYSSLQWGSGVTALYADNSATTSFDFFILSVNSAGVTLAQDYPNVFASFGAPYGNNIHYEQATNLVYSDDRHIVNPSTGASTGMFISPNDPVSTNRMVPDAKLNVAFFLVETNCVFDGIGSCFSIESYDLTTFKYLNSLTMSEIQGQPINMVRWGSSGLAFNTDTGQVYLVDITTLLQTQPAQPVRASTAERSALSQGRRIMTTSRRSLNRNLRP